MKIRKLFSVAITLMVSLSLSAQYATLGTNTFTGNQIIQADLFLRYANFTTGYGKKLYFGGTGEDTDPIWMSRYNYGNDKSELRINIGDNKDGDDKLKIGNETNNLWKSWLTVVNNGRIGIGTETPAYNLDVTGNGRFTSNLLTSGRIGIKNLSPAYDLDVTGTGRFTTNLYISGNVGIKTTSPAFNLDVRGTGRYTGDLIANSDLYIRYESYTTGYSKKLYFGTKNEANDPVWIARYNHGNEKTDLRVNIGDDKYGDDRFVIGSTNNNAYLPWFTVYNNGKVGIGVENPTYQLEVKGTIRATEVRVETGWADFVFDADYTLPSLSEVKAHIEEYRHLPGIPSALEVQENGIGLSEATTLLLQKVEELTLYAIQQSEEIQRLKEENQEFKKLLNK